MKKPRALSLTWVSSAKGPLGSRCLTTSKNYVLYKEGYAALKVATAAAMKLSDDVVPEGEVVLKMLDDVRSIRQRVRAGACSKLEMMHRTRIQGWAVKAKSARLSGQFDTRAAKDLNQILLKWYEVAGVI